MRTWRKPWPPDGCLVAVTLFTYYSMGQLQTMSSGLQDLTCHSLACVTLAIDWCMLQTYWWYFSTITVYVGEHWIVTHCSVFVVVDLKQLVRITLSHNKIVGEAICYSDRLVFAHDSIYAESAICYCPSICLSVRPSVTRVDQSKTEKFWQFLPERGVKQGCGGENELFSSFMHPPLVNGMRYDQSCY